MLQQSNELHCLTGHTDKIVSLSFGTDNIVCSGSLDYKIKLWKIDWCNKVSDSVCYQHHNEVSSITVSHDGAFVVSADRSVTSSHIPVT